MLNRIAQRRLNNELKDLLERKGEENVYRVALIDDTLNNIACKFYGQDAFEGGEYVFTIKLSAEYPLKAPVIKIVTPNGKFSTDVPLCINGLTHYHEAEWNKFYTLRTVIQSFIAYFHQPGSNYTTGGIYTCCENEICTLRQKSAEWNRSLNLKF